MNFKSPGAIKLWLLPATGALWLGTIATMIEITQKVEGAPNYSPWEFAWTIPTMLAGIVMTAWCWSNLKNFKTTEPAREKKHYQLASNRSFIVAACGYLERDRLRHDNMALVFDEVTCSYCIMDMWESAISVNRLVPEAAAKQTSNDPTANPSNNPTRNPTRNPTGHPASRPEAL